MPAGYLAAIALGALDLDAFQWGFGGSVDGRAGGKP